MISISSKEEIKEFLRSKKGYAKKGGRTLRNILREKGFETTIKNCKEAAKEVRDELSTKIIKPDEGRILIYDIETSYNIVKSWRVGYKLNINHGDILKERAIICISYKWLGEDQVYNLRWNDKQCDKFLLEQFIEVMNEADMLVAHNGDRFDLKWIKTRALFHRLPMLVNYNQFDTLKVAKKKFMFNSNRLDYISKFLGHEGKIPTSMKLWDDIILRNCPDAMNKMLEYCDEDVIQLENVYKELMYWEDPKFHAGVNQGKTKQSSPIAGGYNLKLVKTRTTKAGTLKRIMLDLDTNRQFEMSETNYQKYKLIKE